MPPFYFGNISVNFYQNCTFKRIISNDYDLQVLFSLMSGSSLKVRPNATVADNTST